MSNLPVANYGVSDIERIAQAIAASGLFGLKEPKHAFALMLVAQAEGRHPASVAQEYDIIQGRPALKSQAVLGRFQLAGGSVKWIESTDERCVAEFTHPQGGTLSVEWDMARARQAGVAGKDTWKKYPRAMLRARVAAEGVRAVFPACLGGIYSAEEVQDFDDKPKARRGEAVQATVTIEDGSTVDTATGEVVRDAPQDAPEPAGDAIPRHRTEDPPPTQQGPSKAAAVAYVAKTLNEAFPPEVGEDVELPEGQQRVIEALFPGYRTWERVQNATAKDLIDICRLKGGRSTLLDTIDNVRGAMLQEAEGSAHDPHPKPDAEPIRKAIKDTLTRLKTEDPAKARIVSDTILKAMTDAGVTALSEIHDLNALEDLADTIDRLEDAT